MTEPLDGLEPLVKEVESLRARLRALSAVEERRRAIIAAIPDTIFVLDRDERFLDSHVPAGETPFPLPADFLGRTIEEVMPADIARRARTVHARARKTGRLVVEEYDYTTGGETRTFECRVAPVQDGNVVCIVREITDRKHSEAALRQKTARLRFIVENMPGGVVYVKGDEIFFNRAAERIVGYGTSEIPTRERWFQLLHGGDWEAIWRDHLMDKQAGFPEKRLVPIRRKDGKIRAVEYSFAHLDEVEVWLLDDCTDSLQAEERKRQSQKLEAIGQLAGGVAHDFNNLLTGILGYANMLRLDALPGTRAHDAARVIEKAAERASELTRQLLGFARKGKFLNVPVDVHGAIGEVIALLRRTIDKNIVIADRFRAVRAIILGDPSQVQQMILNLAVNARDAMQDGGVMTIETQEENLTSGILRAYGSFPPGKYLRLTVSDTGHGIPSDVREHIFEPFFTTKGFGRGTGLGLATVYGIVKNHGGIIDVESEPGEGTSFVIRLPLHEVAAAVPAPPDAAAKAGVARGNGRIALVDDEEVLREVGESMLRMLGYDVVTLAGGEAAVAYFRTSGNDADLVILDLAMPGMDGRECYRALKILRPGIRVLLSSGYGREGRVQEVIDEGVGGFLQKPYRLQELSDAVCKALRGGDAVDTTGV